MMTSRYVAESAAENEVLNQLLWFMASKIPRRLSGRSCNAGSMMSAGYKGWLRRRDDSHLRRRVLCQPIQTSITSGAQWRSTAGMHLHD